MSRKNLILAAIFVVGFVLFMNVESQVKAAEEWFVLSQKAIKSADQGVDIKSEGRLLNKDIKQVKLSAEGADSSKCQPFHQAFKLRTSQGLCLNCPLHHYRKVRPVTL